MSIEKSGGAAFPGGGVLIPEQEGMTLRQYYKGQAIIGLLGQDLDFQATAIQSGRLADELLKEDLLQ